MSRKPTVAQLLAERVRELRERQDLSQADLARRSSLTRSQIYVLEEGERAATIVTVNAVAQALNVTLSELLAFTPSSNPGPDRADVLAQRLRALGPETVKAIEGIAEVLEGALRPGERSTIRGRGRSTTHKRERQRSPDPES